mgnify:CR=1 FL=1
MDRRTTIKPLLGAAQGKFREIWWGNIQAESDEQRYYEYFTDRRHFRMPTWLERIAGKPIVFALNNAYAKYRQIDIGKKPKWKATDF